MRTKEENFGEVKKIFTAYLENKGLRKTPERFAILEESIAGMDISMWTLYT